MSRIAFFSLPAYGHTNPTLGIVEELTARGHEVVYYSFAMFRQQIEAAGARFVPCDDALPPPPKDLDRRLGRDSASLIELAADTTLALEDRVCRELTGWGAEAVVSDSLCLWGKLFARKLGLPYICSTTTFAFNQETARALQERRSPGELLYFFTGLPRIGRRLRQLRQHGYPVRDPALLFASGEETDTIVYTSRLFQPMGETFQDRYAFIGPVLRCPPQSEEEKSRPVVYVSMGSILHSEPFFQSCMEALGDGRYEVRMAVGRETDTTGWHIPESVTVLPWADQLRELGRADVFLSHAGMNSVSESLYYGVPLVLCPRQSEQRTVADRTAELGAGIVLPDRRPGTIRRAVERVLGDGSYRESAARIGESFRQSGGAGAGAEKILRVIAAGHI